MGEVSKESASEMAARLHVRRTVACVERVEGSVAISKAWAAAVIAHPYVGQHCEDLSVFAAIGEQLGDQLGRTALAALGCPATECASYGKGAIVGAGAEIELGAAILHPRMGRPLRALLGQGKAIIPSTIKRGSPGAHLDVPLHGTDDEWNFSLLDAVEIFVPGAPAHDEIVVVIALGRGGRAGARSVS